MFASLGENKVYSQYITVESKNMVDFIMDILEVVAGICLMVLLVIYTIVITICFVYWIVRKVRDFNSPPYKNRENKEVLNDKPIKKATPVYFRKDTIHPRNNPE